MVEYSNPSLVVLQTFLGRFKLQRPFVLFCELDVLSRKRFIGSDMLTTTTVGMVVVAPKATLGTPTYYFTVVYMPKAKSYYCTVGRNNQKIIILILF